MKILTAMDHNELAAVLVGAVDFRNQILAEPEFGVDLLFPLARSERMRTTMAAELSESIRNLQGMGSDAALFDCASRMIWLHTLRATFEPRLRNRVRDMWAELAKGRTRIAMGEDAFLAATGRAAEIRGIELTPHGFGERQ